MTLAYASASCDPPAIHTQSNAAGLGAQTLSRLLADATTHARSNATDWRPHTSALIEQVAANCVTPGWDGYGASPVDNGAKAQAQRFVDLLPYRMAAPEPSPDVDGEIALVWDFGPGHIFTVSIDKTGTLTYAGLLGGGIKRHGVEKINGEIPRIILQSIDELSERSRFRR